MKTLSAQAVQVLLSARKLGARFDRNCNRTAPAFRGALFILLAPTLLCSIGLAQEPLVITGGTVTIQNLNIKNFTLDRPAGSLTAPFWDTATYGRVVGLSLKTNNAYGPQFRLVRGSDDHYIDIGQNGSGGFTIRVRDVPVFTIDKKAWQSGGDKNNTEPATMSMDGGIMAKTLTVNGDTNFVGNATISGGKKLRVDGGADAANYFSFGGNGTFGIDAPGIPNGRFVVTNSGNVGIGVPDPDQSKAKLAVNGDVAVSGTINGEKPPVKFTINATGKNPWNTVVVDIQDLCGDEDGCRIKLLMRNNNGQVRTSTEEIYISNPDWPKLNGGLGGDTRQSDGTEFSDWVLGTEAKHTLFKSHNWCQARNYVEGGHHLVGVSPTKMALNTAPFNAFGSPDPKRDTAFPNNEKYRISFSCDPNVTATFIIYDR